MASHVRFDSDGESGDVNTVAQNALKEKQTPHVFKTLEKRNTITKHKRNGRKGKEKPIRVQIRSIERLLKNRGDQLSEAVKKKQKSQLEELIRIRDEHDRRDNEKKTVKKYRMVKFFERRKLQRKLDKIMERDRKEDSEEKEQILKDLKYIDRYPKDKKYIALFPTEGHTETSRKRLEEMRSYIEGKSDKVGVQNDEKNANDEISATAEPEKDDFFVY